MKSSNNFHFLTLYGFHITYIIIILLILVLLFVVQFTLLIVLVIICSILQYSFVFCTVSKSQKKCFKLFELKIPTTSLVKRFSLISTVIFLVRTRNYFASRLSAIPTRNMIHYATFNETGPPRRVNAWHRHRSVGVSHLSQGHNKKYVQSELATLRLLLRAL